MIRGAVLPPLPLCGYVVRTFFTIIKPRVIRGAVLPALPLCGYVVRTFFTIIKGTPYGRAKPGRARPRSRGDAEISRGIASWSERNRQAQAGLAGGRAYSGAAACRALRAEAHRARRCLRSAAPTPAGSRCPLQRAPGDRDHATDRAALPAPGILSPRKDHSQGRTSSLRCGRSTLTVIFHGKTPAPIRRTDRTRLALRSHRFLTTSYFTSMSKRSRRSGKAALLLFP